MQKIDVFRVPMSGPDDLTAFDRMIDQGDIVAKDIIAVMGKTEGNGCVNDFTRSLTTLVFADNLATRLNLTRQEVKERVAFVMSGGTEGVMSPHATVFTKTDVEAAPSEEKRLAAASGFTRAFKPEEIGTTTMVDVVAKRVRELMDEASIENIEDVHFVQIKCPLLTSDRIADAKQRGQKVVVEDTYKSMGYSRGASALGVAVALDEVEREKITEKSILGDWSLYSGVASTSAGIELMNTEIIVIGNSHQSASNLSIGHSVMKDAIDMDALLEAMRDAGLAFDALPSEAQRKRIVNVLAKAEASSEGHVRGRRNTMLTDSDINHTRHARAVVNAVVAAVVQDPMVYISGGAEHQGPDGGGPVAVIVRHP